MPPSSPSLFHNGNTFFNLPFLCWENRNGGFSSSKLSLHLHCFYLESTLLSGSPGLQSSFRLSAPSSTSLFIIKNYPSLYFDLQDLQFHCTSHQFQEIISKTYQPFTPESTSPVYKYLGTVTPNSQLYPWLYPPTYSSLIILADGLTLWLPTLTTTTLT